jgi:hypothetical protein
LHSNNKIGIFKNRENRKSIMAITKIENPNKNLLERLKEDNKDVRLYLGEKITIYGKIKEVTNHDVFILPYLVWENVPTPNPDKFLNRCRLETKYEKILPLIYVSPEPLRDGFIEEFAKLQNYFNSLIISDEKLRGDVFNNKIYLMPSEAEIEILKKSLPKA